MKRSRERLIYSINDNRHLLVVIPKDMQGVVILSSEDFGISISRAELMKAIGHRE